MEVKKRVMYGVMLSDMSRRLVGNEELTKDSQTDSYTVYLSNLRKLISYIEESGQPNFFGINRSLLKSVNSGFGADEIPGNPILPLSNTSHLLIFDNILFSVAEYNIADMCGLYGRSKNEFIKIDDVPEEFRDRLKLEGRVLPIVEDFEGQVDYVMAVAKRASIEAILIRKLIRKIKEDGIEEIRLAGERLWYLGGSDVDGPPYVMTANISRLAMDLNRVDGHSFPCRIIKGCTFPLEAKSFDGRYEQHLSNNIDPKWIVSQLLQESISLEEVISGK